jgi:putative S-layer y domain protein
MLVNMLLGNNDKVKDTVFPDVPENHWAYNLVNDLAQRGYIDGYEDGQFKGDRLMTRYEFAAMLDRAVQNGAAINQEMADAIREFKPELDQIKASMRFHVDRISGEDTDLHKVERVRVNTESNRDQYGTVVTK